MTWSTVTGRWLMWRSTLTYNRNHSRSSRTGLSTLRKMAVQVMAAVALGILFMPALGPPLDHHFAERRPDHTHVYMGEAVPDHAHTFERGHVHQHAPLGGLPTTRNLAKRIVYLTSDEGYGRGPLDPSACAVRISLASPRLYANSLSSGIDRGDVAPPPAFVAPPWKPPRS